MTRASSTSDLRRVSRRGSTPRAGTPIRLSAAVLIAGVLVGACTSADSQSGSQDRGDGAADTIEVTSSAFEDDATIPMRFTCDGEDVSPPLSWSTVPADTEELIITVEDPDAPAGTFVHWIVAGIDPSTDGLDAGEVPEGAVEGINDFGEPGYRGPCPPPGDDPHRYRFVVHATAEASGIGEQDAVDELREAIAERTNATGTLTARYGRTG
jgi:Raf kinase inhibitor-like YbhB/YbcL family protein